jgi:hypothetical protein
MYLISYESGIVVDLTLQHGEQLADAAVVRCASMEQRANIIERSTYHLVGTVRWEGDGYVYKPTRTH